MSKFNEYYFEDQVILKSLIEDIEIETASVYLTEIEGSEVLDVAGEVGKRGAVAVGRGIANFIRGVTGRAKTIGLDVNFLKEAGKITKEQYGKLVNDYARALKTKKKFGKRKITIKDLLAGVIDDMSIFRDRAKSKIGDFSDERDVNKEFPPNIPVYKLSNGGKMVLFNLPAERGGDKGERIYAMGLDGKAQKAFQDMHGMTFADYIQFGGGREKYGNDSTRKDVAKYGYDKLDKNKFLDYVGREKKQDGGATYAVDEISDDGKGKLYGSLRDNKVSVTVSPIEENKNIKQGFQYTLKRGGIVYLFEHNNGSFWIGWSKPDGEKALVSIGWPITAAGPGIGDEVSASMDDADDDGEI